jgi:hypothetical protein
MFVLRYVKRELLLFYNSNDKIIFWIERSSANAEKLAQIVEFIQGRVSPRQPQSMPKP